jgi:hypothetical protein
MAIIDHATAEIKAFKEIFNYRSVLIANFAFLIRVMMYHIILVAFVHLPWFTITMLLFVETSYMFLIARNFVKIKYLVSLHLFWSRIT